MRYIDFERVMSSHRMGRYYTSCNGNTKKAMTLYRYNLCLSQEMFTLISCFEVVLRNAIDKNYTNTLGKNWLIDAGRPGGIFANSFCSLTAGSINEVIARLGKEYAHPKVVAELGFGFWRYLFSRHQYRAAGQSLLSIFPLRPHSTPTKQYNSIFIFNELAKINRIRNRIAHHEPICFIPAQSVKDTTYARQHYNLILQLFQWMQIDESALLYGLDHIADICNQIDAL